MKNFVDLKSILLNFIFYFVELNVIWSILLQAYLNERGGGVEIFTFKIN